MTTASTADVSQRDVIAFLASADTWGQPVERIATHSAVVFLVGDRALKLKRCVRYSYLDFSTLALRQQACDAEVALNSRTAPLLYRGTVAVTVDAHGRLAIGGTGRVVEWLVDMSRFDQADLLDRMAAAGRLDRSLMPRLAADIASFHRGAEVTREHGGVDGILRVVEGAVAGMRAQGAGILSVRRVADWELTARAMAERHRDVLEERRLDGFVRRCHGDLHLRNLVLLDGAPTLFDALEFNDDLSCIDVWYDLAFLLMDLAKRELRAHANVVLNAYLRRTNDTGGLVPLPLFLSCRAAVRAMTSATAARLQPEAGARAGLERLAAEYLDLALADLRPRPQWLVAVGGLSGSGKSSLAHALAPNLARPPGAVLIRSDEVRKSLCGVTDDTRLGPDGYRPAVTARVYEALMQRADTVLRTGSPVVVDAVFAKPDDRATIEAVAHQLGVPFVGIWLDAPPDVLRSRVVHRTGDASDADIAVVESQLRTPPGTITWHRLDAALPLAVLARHAESFLTNYA